MSHDKIFNWAPKFDERSKDFTIGELIKKRPVRRDKQWRSGQILDQGREGACVGFGWTAEALATPVPVNLAWLKVDAPRTPNEFAANVYHIAKTIDDYAGEDYDGTSVLAGAKVMQQFGLIKEYRWAFGIEDVIDSLLAKGPVVLGIWWYDGMYSAPNGVLKVSGKKVGGHCITAVGYKTAASSKTGEASIILQNSWGEDWGINGLAEISVKDLAALLKDGGEACVPIQRGFGYRYLSWLF